MKKCVDYYMENGSRVFVTFMDCHKGFDKVGHDGIFLKLLERGLPLCFLLLMMYWCSDLGSICKWGQARSRCFEVLSGVRQGGILSPHIFCLYVDDLIIRLRRLHIGCYLINQFVGCIFYADDLALLSPSRESMQLLLNATIEYGDEFCMSFSFHKTETIIFGKSKNLGPTAPLIINDGSIEIVQNWRYLGFHVKAGNTFGFTAHPDLCSFRRASNCLLNTFYKPSEEVMMRLLYTNCIPILSYGSQVKEYNHADTAQVSVAVNDSIRKIFGYARWMSIRTLRIQMGYRGIEEIFAVQRQRFLSTISQLDNDLLKFILVFNS